MKTIHYVSAPAGSGKTHNLVQHAVDEARAHRKVLIAQPTKELIRQTRDRIRKLDPTVSVRAIYGTPSDPYAVAKVQDHLTNTVPNQGEVLLITHVALKRISGVNRRFWDLVIDEIPNVFGHEPLQIAVTHHHITPHLKTTQIVPGILSLDPGNRNALEALLANPTKDQNIATFAPLLGAVLDDKVLVCVAEDRYDDLLNNPSTIGHMDFFTVLKDSFVDGFNSVAIMGANAESSELFVVWNALLNIDFKPHPTLGKSLLYSTHGNGHRLTISYLFDKGWSKTYASSAEDETSVLDRVQEVVRHFMSGRRFLWQANKSAGDAFFAPADRLDHVAHGQDKPELRSCHAVVLLAAVNRRPAAYRFLDLIGVDSTKAHTMLTYHHEYQAMMRCSLREPAATAPVDVVVASRGSAEWLAEQFPGARIMKLDHDIEERRPVGRPAKPTALSSTERSRLSRERAKAKREADRAEWAKRSGRI